MPCRMGRREGKGSGSSRVVLGRRSSKRDMQRLKSGKGEEVRDFIRMFIITSGL